MAAGESDCWQHVPCAVAIYVCIASHTCTAELKPQHQWCQQTAPHEARCAHSVWLHTYTSREAAAVCVCCCAQG
jgi:hypothetical protein